MKAKWTGWGFVAPFLAVFAFALIAPIGYAIYLSLFRQQLIGGNTLVWFANYRQALADPQFWGSVRRLSSALHVGLPDPLSGSWVLASVGNIVTWEFAGYNMLIFYAALRAVPGDLYEAAEIDGAGGLRIAASIKLPALRPALVVAVVFSIIGSLQLFTEPNILKELAPDTITSTFTPNLYAFNLSFAGQEYNYSAAIAVIMGVLTVAAPTAVQGFGRRRAA